MPFAATSFPLPILMGAAFDDPLIYDVASIIGKEARAFANYAHSGYDFWVRSAWMTTRKTC